jgi:hypothetical protein
VRHGGGDHAAIREILHKGETLFRNIRQARADDAIAAAVDGLAVRGGGGSVGGLGGVERRAARRRMPFAHEPDSE